MQIIFDITKNKHLLYSSNERQSITLSLIAMLEFRSRSLKPTAAPPIDDDAHLVLQPHPLSITFFDNTLISDVQ
jgi:hypothetical protein